MGLSLNMSIGIPHLFVLFLFARPRFGMDGYFHDLFPVDVLGAQLGGHDRKELLRRDGGLLIGRSTIRILNEKRG